MTFRLAPGKTQQKSAVTIAWQAVLLIGVIAGGLFVGWLMRHNEKPSGEPEIDPRPVIVSLQNLGDLHTIKLNMKDVLQKTSEQGAVGWAKDLPGVDAASRWATHNEVLVVAQGSVEAGVDLSSLTEKNVSQVQRSDGTRLLRVHLPPVTVYPPAVEVRIVHTQSGLLWTDKNLLTNAEAEAKKRFLDAAEKDGIQEHARDSAIQRLEHLQQVIGNRNIEFYF